MIHYEVNYHPRNLNRRQTDITESSLVKSIDSLWFVLIRKYLKFFLTNWFLSFILGNKYPYACKELIKHSNHFIIYLTPRSR